MQVYVREPVQPFGLRAVNFVVFPEDDMRFPRERRASQDKGQVILRIVFDEDTVMGAAALKTIIGCTIDKRLRRDGNDAVGLKMRSEVERGIASRAGTDEAEWARRVAK